jgi:pSer/pThr/pTyr-binding forkhead associated (FHA) protein
MIRRAGLYKLKLHLHGAEVRELELATGHEYVFGRGASCDVQLEEQPGISRSHFRVFEENGQWTVQVLSKFGHISHAGQPVQSLSLEPGSVFQLAGYAFHFAEISQSSAQGAASPSSSLPQAVGQSESTYDSGHDDAPPENHRSLALAQPKLPVPVEFEGNDEATRVMESVTEVPFLRIVEKNGMEDTMTLEGRRWLAGRDKSCNILLNDKKASRRQFELTATSQGYFVRDLGSANGTLLNGMPMAADELKPLRSGDVIQVGAVTLHFEVRDPSFEKRLMVVPPEIRSDLPIVVQNPYEFINYPVPMGPGGAVRIDGGGGSEAWNSRNKLVAYALGDDLQDEKAKKKRRFMLVVGAVLALLLLVLFTGEDKAPPKPKQTALVNEAFSRLSPPQQQKVRETFILAKNLYMQKKLALAADQLAKLHEMLPDGYENSIAMAQDCREAAEQEEQLRFVQEQQKKIEENRRIVEETLARCDNLSNSTMDPEALRRCLLPALDREPEHPMVIELMGRVTRRVEERNMQQSQRRIFEESAQKGRALFVKAEKLEKDGYDQDAIDAYKKHVNSSFPDPNGLKNRSRQNMLALTRRLSSKIDESLRNAESAYSQRNYRDAISQIKKAKAIDPMNEKAAELNAKVRRELNAKLKEIYEESIIAEGIGNIDEAKKKWKDIVDMDHPEGEYFKKARNKLRAYGAF